MTFENFYFASSRFNNPKTIIDVSQLDAKNKLRLAQWADKNSYKLSRLGGWPSSMGLYGEYFVVGEALEQQILESLLDPQLMPPINTNDSGRIPAPKIFSHVDDLIDYIELPDQPTRVQRELLPSDARITALVEAYERDRYNPLYLRHSTRDGDCSTSCLKSTNPSRHGEYYSQYRIYEIEDTVYRQDIVLTNAQNKIAGYASLSKNRLLVMVLIDRDSHSNWTSIRVYSPRGDIMYSQSRDSTYLDQWQEERSQLRKNFRGSMIIGLCEEQFSLKEFEKNGLSQRLLLGPYPELSYFGWQSDNQLPGQYYFGKEYYNELQLPFSEQSFASHAVQTAELLADETSAQELAIVPLGATQCLHAPLAKSLFEAIRTESRLRVINISATELSDNKTCARLTEDHTLFNGQYLWVAAAGNLSQSETMGCPQHLFGQPNIVVVGATVDGRMHPNSNSGVESVDIGTNGQLNEHWGTSLAAPRVSLVAAKIFAHYPKLNTLQVKASLLLSAKMPRGKPLPMRSGGELNEEDAFQIAEALDKGQSFTQAVEQVYDDRLVNKQYKFKYQLAQSLEQEGVTP